MKRGLTLLLAVIVFFVGDRIGGVVLDHLLFRSQQRFPRMYSGRFDADTVVIGNSRGVNMLDQPFAEEQTGRSIANISHNAMPPKIARAIVSDYLDHNPKPKRLIVEVSNVTTPTTEGTMLDYKPFWSRSERLRDLGETFSPLTAAACRVTHLYRFNSEMFIRAMSYLASGNSDQNAVMPMLIPQALVEETQHMEPIELKADPQELTALREMVAEARAADLEVHLVLAPYLPSHADRIANLDEFVADLSAALGEPVQDFSRAIEDTESFADRVHMNPDGTRKFTKKLIESGVL